MRPFPISADVLGRTLHDPSNGNCVIQNTENLSPGKAKANLHGRRFPFVQFSWPKEAVMAEGFRPQKIRHFLLVFLISAE